MKLSGKLSKQLHPQNLNSFNPDLLHRVVFISNTQVKQIISIALLWFRIIVET